MPAWETGCAWPAWPTSRDTRSSPIPSVWPLCAPKPRRLPKVAAGQGEVSEWTGLRPATPRGTPIIGPTPYRNLWLNIGHDALGFTLATGSAALLASWLEDPPHPAPSRAFALSH